MHEFLPDTGEWESKNETRHTKAGKKRGVNMGRKAGPLLYKDWNTSIAVYPHDCADHQQWTCMTAQVTGTDTVSMTELCSHFLSRSVSQLNISLALNTTEL